MEGADVLSDSLRIAFRRAKPEFITVFFERHQVLRFADADAVRKYSSFTLPESLDPTFDRQDLPFARKDSLPRPLYFNAEVVFCRARKLGNNADAGALPVEGRIIRQRVKQGDRFHEAWSYAINVIGALPGDTIEVHWKYSVPFMENWMKFNAQRLFLHGALYKHASTLILEADGMQGFQHWGIPPDSTSGDGRTTKEFWTLKNLGAVADEVNARWYAELPFLTIGTMQDAQFYSHVTRSGIAVDIPYWAKVMRLREANAHWWRQVAVKNVPDAQSARMKDFMALYPGDDPIDRLERMHTAIATTFDYQVDDAWYDDKDRTNQRMGDQLRDKRLREISRYDLYSKLISMLRLKYFTGYLMDKRVGFLSLDWLSPVWDNEWMFLLNHKGTPLHLYPKRTRFGSLPGEIPFYWEGTRALVGDVDKLWADGELGAPTAIEPELVAIPALLPEVNQRLVTIDMDVDLDAGSMHATADVLLSGQWSTLARGAYLFGATDSSIDPGYGRRIFDVHSAAVEEVQLGTVQTEAPFRFPLRAEFTLSGRIVEVNDTTWIIDVSDLFQHVVPSEFKADGRDLSFWFDFEGTDRMVVNLHCSRPVDVHAGDPASPYESAGRELSGGQASFVFNVDRPQTDVIRLSSTFTVANTRVPMAQAHELEDLFNLIALPNGRITVIAQAPVEEGP